MKSNNKDIHQYEVDQVALLISEDIQGNFARFLSEMENMRVDVCAKSKGDSMTTQANEHTERRQKEYSTNHQHLLYQV